MQFSFSERQAEIFARFAELGRSVAARAEQHDAERKFDFHSWQRICDAGIWRIPVPVDLGGTGGSWIDCIVAMEGVASTANDLGFLITMLASVGALRTILVQGTPEQKARWLEPLMRGAIGLTAMTEQRGGSDLARMRLAATADGDAWRLRGRKVHITNAPIANMGVIAGRIPALGEKKDITLFFIDMPAPGLSLGELEDNLGIRTSPTADLIFDDVRVDRTNIIGKPGEGLKLLYDTISFERALYGIISSGVIESMMKVALERVQNRHAFQRPLADFQYVQLRITDMKVWAMVNRLLTYSAIEKVESGATDASIACSAAKLLAGEYVLAASEHLVQLHGHLGFMRNELSRQLRDAVGMRIAGGTSDIQRVNIFNQLRRLQEEAAALPVAAE
jgi:alkylation response protein AidB-like acyl-CoA dehydrogenase